MAIWSTPMLTPSIHMAVLRVSLITKRQQIIQEILFKPVLDFKVSLSSHSRRLCQYSTQQTISGSGWGRTTISQPHHKVAATFKDFSSALGFSLVVVDYNGSVMFVFWLRCHLKVRKRKMGSHWLNSHQSYCYTIFTWRALAHTKHIKMTVA